MNIAEKQNIKKRSGSEGEYFGASKDNLDYYVKKNAWLVENYNSISRNISDRLSALAGISIGLLPLIFQYLGPNREIEVCTIVCILVLLVSSIVAGSIDSIASLSFWDKNIKKNIQAIVIWQEYDNYPGKEESDYNQASEKISALGLNKNLKISEIALLLQVVTAIFAIASQVFYLYIKILG